MTACADDRYALRRGGAAAPPGYVTAGGTIDLFLEDNADFAAVVRRLEPARRQWLADAQLP